MSSNSTCLHSVTLFPLVCSRSSVSTVTHLHNTTIFSPSAVYHELLYCFVPQNKLYIFIIKIISFLYFDIVFVIQMFGQLYA